MIFILKISQLYEELVGFINFFLNIINVVALILLCGYYVEIGVIK